VQFSAENSRRFATSPQVTALKAGAAPHGTLGTAPALHLQRCQFSAENWHRCNTEFSVSEGWL
jgi:hypothetical protein